MVVAVGHELRCRPKVVKGEWSDARRMAWLGDSVHRVDVQLAMQFLGIAPARWEIEAQRYTRNESQAIYLRDLFPEFVGRSDHSVGTEFEARYVGDFRFQYLSVTFPTCAVRILMAWQPPVFH